MRNSKSLCSTDAISERNCLAEDVAFYSRLLRLTSLYRLLLTFSFRDSGRLLSFATPTAQFGYYTMRRTVHIFRYDDANLGVRIGIPSHVASILRTVTRASELIALAPFQNNGRTKRHSPPKNLPIPWPRWRKDGWRKWVTHSDPHRDLPDEGNSVPDNS